jgi:hypothetical protein
MKGEQLMRFFNYSSFFAIRTRTVTINIWKPLRFWALTYTAPNTHSRWGLEVGPFDIWIWRNWE